MGVDIPWFGIHSSCRKARGGEAKFPGTPALHWDTWQPRLSFMDCPPLPIPPRQNWGGSLCSGPSMDLLLHCALGRRKGWEKLRGEKETHPRCQGHPLRRGESTEGLQQLLCHPGRLHSARPRCQPSQTLPCGGTSSPHTLPAFPPAPPSISLSEQLENSWRTPRSSRQQSWGARAAPLAGDAPSSFPQTPKPRQLQQEPCAQPSPEGRCC